jgi:hypothetical protein
MVSGLGKHITKAVESRFLGRETHRAGKGQPENQFEVRSVFHGVFGG